MRDLAALAAEPPTVKSRDGNGREELPTPTRWCIFLAYSVPLVVITLSMWFIPSSAGRFGGAVALIGPVAVSGVASTILLLVGVTSALISMIRTRGRYRWYDYLLTVAGILPLVVLAVGLVMST